MGFILQSFAYCSIIHFIFPIDSVGFSKSSILILCFSLSILIFSSENQSGDAFFKLERFTSALSLHVNCLSNSSGVARFFASCTSDSGALLISIVPALEFDNCFTYKLFH